MNYIFSKKTPEVGDRGFIIGDRFISISNGLNVEWSTPIIYDSDLVINKGNNVFGYDEWEFWCSGSVEDVKYLFCAFSFKNMFNDFHSRRFLGQPTQNGYIVWRNLKKKVNIKTYQIGNGAEQNYMERSVKNFRLEGSDDGINWIVLDTRTNIYGNSTPSDDRLQNIYTIDNEQSFYYHRIYIENIYQNSDCFRIGNVIACNKSLESLKSKNMYESLIDDNTLLFIPMYGNKPFEDKSKNHYEVINHGVIDSKNEYYPEWSNGSGYFSNKESHIWIAQNVLGGLTEFTLDFYYKFSEMPQGNSYSNSFYVLSNGPTGSPYGVDIHLGSSQIHVTVDIWESRNLISYTPNYSWHYFKITKNSSNKYQVFQDYWKLGEFTDSSQIYNGENYGTAIGRSEPLTPTEGQLGFRGYIANYRISNVVR